MSITYVITKKKKSKKKRYDQIGFMDRENLPAWKSELVDLSNTYTNLEYGQREVRKKHGSVFTKLEELETQKEEVKLKIQEIARKRAQQGKTIHLVNLPDVLVYVCGNEKKQEYSLAKARKYWPEDVLLKVLEVNGAMVEQLLKEGFDGFDEETAEKAKLPREASTPAVNIRIRKKY